MRIHYALLLCLFIIIPIVAASDTPNVTLILPANNNVSLSSDMTFICNITDDENIFNISLYTNIDGSFSLYNTTRIMELESNGSTLLLCHFNNDYTCDAGETGTASSADFVQSNLFRGVRINNSATLTYSTINNIDYEKGTVEFWVNVGVNTSIANNLWLFSTGAALQNEFQIFISSGTLYFYIYDDYGYVTSATKTINWNQGEWHHVAAQWNIINYLDNGYVIDLFIDGSNQGTSISENIYSFSFIGQTISIGSRTDGLYQTGSAFDELYILDIPISAEDINASYFKVSLNHTNQSANWTITNIFDGTYIWNCLAHDNQSQASWNSTNYTFSIDTSSPPNVNSITIAPNTTADIDPGVTINVTANITDPSNVDTAILQYKYDIDWINITMSNAQDIWNASFTTIGSERIYYYRIYANDSLGRSNTTQNLSINVTLDYNWTHSPSSMNVYGVVDSIGDVGIITVNNTGDDTIIITITDDWPIIDVYYNTTDQFAISAGNSMNINVTAKFAGLDSTSNMTITLSAEPSAPGRTASPASLNTIVTMNSYSGGPYLVVNLVTVPTSVSQSQTGINLSATVKNIGNNTAVDVWFNWSLPSGWLNTSGSLYTFIGNMSAQSPYNASNLVISINSTAISGVATICINATATGNVNMTNETCSIVQVSCSNTDNICGNGCVYTNDIDCPAQPTTTIISGGGGYISTAGGVITINPGIRLDVPSRIDVFRGEKTTFYVNILNTESKTTLNNVRLSISGYPQTQMRIVPIYFDILEYGSPQKFTIELTIPEYIKFGPYNLSLISTSDFKKSNLTKDVTRIKAAAHMILFVHSITENETVELVKAAEQSYDDMLNANLNTDEVTNLIDRAKTAIDNFDYDTAKKLSEEIIGIKNKAFTAQSLIQSVEQQIEKAQQYGINVPESQKLYAMSIVAFGRGDYERAAERASNALLTYNIEAGDKVFQSQFLQNYWGVMIISIFAGVIIIIIGRRKIALNMLKKRLYDLEREEQTILNLIKTLQIQCFEQKTISEQEYKANNHEYENRLTHIKKERSRLLSQQIKLLRLKAGREDFQKQKNHIVDLIKETQRKYFELRTISKTTYKETMHELNDELAEIQKNIEKKKKHKKKILSIIMIFLMSSTAFAINDNQTFATEAINIAETHIQEMQENGFSIIRVNDTLKEAKFLFSEENYLGAMSLAKYIGILKETAFHVNKLIDDVEANIYEAELQGIDVSSVQKLRDEALIAFNNEMYEDAETMLQETLIIINEKKTQIALQKTLEKSEQETFVNLIQRNWRFIIMFLSGLAIFILVGYKITETSRQLKKIQALRNEKHILEDMIKKIQKQYFKEHVISKNEYTTAMTKYRARLSEIQKDIIIFEHESNIKHP